MLNTCVKLSQTELVGRGLVWVRLRYATTGVLLGEWLTFLVPVGFWKSR